MFADLHRPNDTPVDCGCRSPFGRLCVSLVIGGVFSTVLAVPVAAAEPTSKNNARLRQALQQVPQADTDGDGVLTFTEARAFLSTPEGRRQSKQFQGGAESGSSRPASSPDLSAMEKKGRGLWVASTGHSLVAPALGPFAAAAKAAGYEGHLQVRQLSGGATGSPRAHWEKPEKEQTVKRALATGKCDVLTMGLHPEGSEVEDLARWIDLGLAHNPEMTFYIQDVWPRVTELLPETGKRGSESNATFDAYENRVEEINGWTAGLVEKLEVKYPGKVRVIPVSGGMLELVRRRLAGKLPGVEAIFVSRNDAGDTRIGLYRDSIHPTDVAAALEGYIYFACLYKKNPAELAEGLVDNAELDRALREVAWQVVTKNPHTGVE